MERRVFGDADQQAFAALSGDFNPMHVDPVTARRVGAGGQVVHGVHNLLWGLEAMARRRPEAGRVSRLRADFVGFVTVGEPVEAGLVQSDAAQARLEIRRDGARVVEAAVEFGARPWVSMPAKAAPVVDPATPVALAEEDVAGHCGTLPFARAGGSLAAAFPEAARLLGARRVLALGAFTRLVGMACPGLHSVFHKIALEASEDDGADDIGFAVSRFNAEHRHLLCRVWGGGWVGTLTSTIRARPMAQPSIEQVADAVGRGAFAGRVALVVGGSRGMGEVVAKIIAAGGGTAIITYASGFDDARRVAAEIGAWGGRCHVRPLDVCRPVAAQLIDLPARPDQLYYFATPMIAGGRAALFDAARLERFLAYYVAGFHACCQALIDAQAGPLSAFYPSSVFVEERPAGLTEYAMAKAAGEQLCRDMNDRLTSLRVVARRLPRLATDQNAGLSEADAAPVLATMLEAVRDVAAAPG